MAHTKGPWNHFYGTNGWYVNNQAGVFIADVYGDSKEEAASNAQLIATAPVMFVEMERYLFILEAVEGDVELWNKLTKGTGISTLNGYRHAINKAKGI